MAAAAPFAASRSAGRLAELAEIAGGTPFYLYDRAAIRRRVAAVRGAFAGRVRLVYSMKANPWQPVLQLLAALVDGIDVASGAEMRAALSTGVAGDDVYFAGPAKTEQELRGAIVAGVTLSIESERELERVREIAAALSRRAAILLRLNPDFELAGSGLKMGARASQFGMDPATVAGCAEAVRSDELAFRGYHLYWGSQCLDAHRIVDAQTRCVELVDRMTGVLGLPPRVINLGGGFGIPYGARDGELDLAAIGGGIAAWHPHVAERYPRADVVVELGRYLIGEAGVYVTRVVDRKVSRGETFLVTDGGLHHNLAATGNFGQVLRRNYPISVERRSCSDGVERVNVVGCLCTPIDLFAKDIELPRTEVGDLVAIAQSGAYGHSASPLGFLGHPEPPQLLL